MTMQATTTLRVNAAIAISLAILFAGLSPSFIDWQTSTDAQKKQIVIYYGIAIGLGIYAVTRRG